MCKYVQNRVEDFIPKSWTDKTSVPEALPIHKVMLAPLRGTKIILWMGRWVLFLMALRTLLEETSVKITP